MKNRLPNPHIPAASETAKEKARYRAMIAFRESHRESQSEPEPRAGWWRLGVMGTATMAAVLGLIATLTNSPRNPADSTLLAQMQELFGPALSAIVEKNGEIDVLTDPEATTGGAQPIVIEVGRGSEKMRILGFSGRPLRIPLRNESLHVDPLITASGEVILVGDDFVIDAKSGPIDGTTLRASQLKATL